MAYMEFIAAIYSYGEPRSFIKLCIIIDKNFIFMLGYLRIKIMDL